jgi:proteasome accessory factor A
MNPLPKLCGADVELGNFILGVERIGGTCDIASRILLEEIRDQQGAHYGASGSFDRSGGPQPRGGNGGSSARDWGRTFLASNGGCVYIDLDHLELCLPEVLSAYDHAACWEAMLRVAAKALASANGKLRRGTRIQALVNNSDGLGHSYGSHLNFLIARRAWDNIFRRKLQHMLFLAAYQVSSIVFTGQGKVGAENGAPRVDYQISQRADFFEQLAGPQTTVKRPLVNSRDEALAGPPPIGESGGTDAEAPARLHVIFYDNTLCPAACLLKVGVMQIILCMLEHERINPGLFLDDPLEAVVRWSHDPSLRAKARTAAGRYLTALELQQLFLEEVRKFLETAEISRYVPRAREITALWEDTLKKLQAGDMTALAGRLDWVLKMNMLERVLGRHPHLHWRSAEIKHLDQIYSSLDPSEGLYWACARDGFVERLVEESRIGWLERNPPEDTRAWTRSMILRIAPPESLDSVDWDSIRIKTRGRGYLSRYVQLDMADPFGFTKEAAAADFQKGGSLEEILDRLARHGFSPDAGETKGPGP